MLIRKALDSDFDDVFSVEYEAFGSHDIANLVKDLLNDPTAEPSISLLAVENQRAVGHILFTKAHSEPESDLSVYILAPLAVIPEYQNQGIGGKLINEGLRYLKHMNVDIVFVLGHPGYYPRHGFISDAGRLGFEAPYPIEEKHADAWMLQELRPDIIGNFRGKIRCADALDKPEHWRE